MPTLLRPTFVLQPTAVATSWTGWLPWLGGHLLGPIESGSQLVAALDVDGVALWSATTDLRPTEAGETAAFLLGDHHEAHQLHEAGPLHVRLSVATPGGAPQLLHECWIEIGCHQSATGTRHYFVADPEWSARAHLWFDRTARGGPALGASVWCEGEPGEVRAMLLRDGARVRPGGVDEWAQVASWGRSLSSQRGDVTHCELTLTFPRVRAWLDDEPNAGGDGAGCHVLDRAPGAYEIKLLRNGLLDRVVPFEIGDDGRLVEVGAVDVDPQRGHVVAVPVVLRYGPPTQVATTGTATLDHLYAGHPRTPLDVDRVPGPELIETAQLVVTRAAQLAAWYHDTLVMGGEGPGFLLSCRTALERATAMLAALEPVIERIGPQWTCPPADHDHDAAARTTAAVAPDLGQVRSQLNWMEHRAAFWIDCADHRRRQELEPFRAALRSDKLAVFDEHPLPEHRYYTRGGAPLRTPAELDQADTWWLEDDGAGPQHHHGLRWNLIGWRFDDEHAIVERLGASGFGTDAPRSAFG